MPNPRQTRDRGRGGCLRQQAYRLARCFLRFAQYAFIRFEMAARSAALHAARFCFCVAVGFFFFCCFGLALTFDVCFGFAFGFGRTCFD